MNDLPTSDHAAAAERLAGITRLIRRICLLREQGKAGDANRLQAGELAGLLAEFRLWHGPDTLTEDKVCALFMHETDLVREAMVLAEIMAPQLAQLLPLAQAQPHAPVFPSVPQERAQARPVPEGPPAISDLLDAMLAAERPGRRLPPANPRPS